MIVRRTNSLLGAVVLGMAMIGCNSIATGSRLGDTVIFVISEADVVEAVEQDERISIKLSPDASARLSDFASRNKGKLVDFVVGDIRILRVVINAIVTSGLIRSEVLEESERARLFEFLGKDNN